MWDEGDLNWYDYGFRNYDPQIGRFTQLDPLTDDYPMMTPYQYASCEPIANIDIDGLEGGAANIVNDGLTFLSKAGEVLIREGAEVIIQAKKAVVTTVAKKTSSFWGTLKKIGNVAKDFVPFANAAVNIYEGVRDGDWKKVGMGVVEGVVDAATLGTGSVAKGLIKTGVKQLVRNEAKTIVKRKADDLARTVKNKVDDVVKKKPPCGCFTAGTLVLTAEGYKEIQTIQVGDIVWAYNDTTGQLAQKRVINVFEYERDSVYHITLANGTIIKATSDHPFFIGGCWLKVHELQAGDVTALYNGEALAITHIEIVAQPAKVYNFEVADFHTYYVSEERVLVHNSTACKTKYGGQHGSQTHNDRIEDLADKISKDKDNVDIRKNRRQVDANGNVVGNNRPDLSWKNQRTGKRYNVEYDTKASSSKKHKKQVTANDPNGVNKFYRIKK